VWVLQAEEIQENIQRVSKLSLDVSGHTDMKEQSSAMSVIVFKAYTESTFDPEDNSGHFFENHGCFCHRVPPSQKTEQKDLSEEY